MIDDVYLLSCPVLGYFIHIFVDGLNVAFYWRHFQVIVEDESEEKAEDEDKSVYIYMPT
jgi:hypothetical protein